MKLKTATMLGAVTLALGLGTAAHAAYINGGISFSGGYLPQNSSGVTQPNLNNATQIAFGTTFVGPVLGTSQDFTSIPDLTLVTMFTPLVISPLTLPGTPFWTVTAAGDTFSFDLTSLNIMPPGVTGSFPGTQSLTLTGMGTLRYSGLKNLQDTPGTWIGTFNAGGGTFTWSASNAAGPPVPDGGTTVALLGGALIGLAGLRRKFSNR